MYLKSSYPDVPPQPNVNAHDFFFNKPSQADLPNFTVHIDAETGEKILYYDFLERIRDLATGLGASVDQGGLGIRAEDKEIIGIMGENSSVSVKFFLFDTLLNPAYRNISPWCMLLSGWPHLSLQFLPIQLLLS